jgi:hypothetical protein
MDFGVGAFSSPISASDATKQLTGLPLTARYFNPYFSILYGIPKNSKRDHT